MLDFNTEGRIKLDNKKDHSFTSKIKSSINKEISAKNARNASFITLASVLSACNFGGSSDSIAPLNISAIKGPLSNALAFVDRDGDGVHDDGEEFAVTSSTGSASITPTSAVSATDKLVITSITAGQTIGGTTYATGTVDTNTGGAVADLVLKAPSNSTVVTPVTTLVAETGLSESAVKEVLGLPTEMDVLNFNPFAENLSEADKTVALAAEKVALKVYTTVSTIQASAKSSGLDAAKAFETAIEAVGDVVKEQSAAGTTADLADSSIIDKVVTKTETVLTSKLQEAGFEASVVTAAVNANKAVLATAKAQIKTVNDAADAITSFDATELGAIAKLAVKSGEEAAAAVTAEKAAPGSGAAKFTMKTADAVETAKAEAKAEVEAAKGEESSSTTTATTGASSSATANFVLTDGTTVDWAITNNNSGASTTISTSTSPDATYTMSGSTMTIDLGQKFRLKTVQDLLTEKADLTLALSLASLPSTDDSTPNTTTVTLTEGLDNTISSGEGQIKASTKSTFKATSTTSTEFIFDGGDPISISYTPRSGNSDVSVSVTNPSVNTYTVSNDGNFNNNGGVAVMEAMVTKFFTKLDAYSTANAWAKNNILSKFVTSNSEGVHISMDVSDLGVYNGSTQVKTIQTTLAIGDNPTTGGVISGTARTGTVVSVTDIADLDGINGSVTHQWQRSTDDGANWSNISGANSKSYTLTATDADFNGDTNLSDASQIRYTATYTDKQGKAYTGNDMFVAVLKDANGTAVEVTANKSPGGSLAMTGGNHVGATLTADGSGITDADGIPTGGISYHWEIATNGSAYQDISGTAGTASTTNTTYTIQPGDVTNKTTKIRAVAEYTDNLGAAEVVNGSGTAAAIAKPIVYLQKVGTATTSKVEIGIFLDDELLTTDAQKQFKTWQVNITPQETWATNFDGVVDGVTDASSGAPTLSYFHDGSGGEWTVAKYKATQELSGTTIDAWDTGSFQVAKSVLDAGNGKVTINPQGTGTAIYNLKFKHTTGLDTADIKLASLYLDPKALGKTVKFDIGSTNTFYGYRDGNTTYTMDSNDGSNAQTTFLTDPYVFELVL